MLNDVFPLRVEAVPAARASEWRADDSFPPRQTQAWQLIYVCSGTIEERCDDRRVLLRCVLISEGSANATAVSVAKVVSEALKCGATGVMLAHNHPRGITLPSSSDMAVTREIYRALRLVNIQLLEHLIFADNEFLSFVQSNYMDSIRQSVQD